MRGSRRLLLPLCLTICAVSMTSCSLFTRTEVKEVRVLVDRPVRCHLEPRPPLLPFSSGLVSPGTNGCPQKLTLWDNGACITDEALRNLTMNYGRLKEWVNGAWQDCEDLAPDAGVPTTIDGGVP